MTRTESKRASSRRSTRQSALRSIQEIIFLAALAVALAQGVKAFAVQPFVVPSGSMLPTIQLRDRVLAEKFTYRFIREPRAGDVVVFDNPDPTNTAERIYIKRVIAVGGQTVDIRDDRVWVDGVPIDEPYTHSLLTQRGSVQVPLTVPKGWLWLMGDNRPGSGDSRVFGPQPVAHVRGRVVWTYWPIGRFGELR